MGSRKRPCDKTIEGGRLRALLAASLAYVVGTNSIVVKILNSLLLPITKEVRLCISQGTISAYATHLVNVFIEVLTEWSLART